MAGFYFAPFRDNPLRRGVCMAVFVDKSLQANAFMLVCTRTIVASAAFPELFSTATSGSNARHPRD